MRVWRAFSDLDGVGTSFFRSFIYFLAVKHLLRPELTIDLKKILSKPGLKELAVKIFVEKIPLSKIFFE